MEFSNLLKTYEEIEPMPDLPPRPSFRMTFVTWAMCAIVSVMLVDSTHGIILFVWIGFWARLIRLLVTNQFAHRKFHRDLDAWSVRANAHHEKVMRQIQQYANRDWN